MSGDLYITLASIESEIKIYYVKKTAKPGAKDIELFKGILSKCESFKDNYTKSQAEKYNQKKYNHEKR